MPIPRLKAGGRAFAHIAQYHPELVALRRDLHAHPELGFEEVYTAARVKEALQACGVDAIADGIGRTGLVATIRGRSTASGSMVGCVPTWTRCPWPNTMTLSGSRPNRV